MAQRKRNIEFARPDEPDFLKKLKSKIGFQGEATETVETKKESLDKARLTDLIDREDEQPVYVIDADSRITENELDEFKNKIIEKAESEPIEEASSDKPQKILFTKPTRSEQQQSQQMQTTQRSGKQNTTEQDKISDLKAKANIKSVKNANLLSFQEDDDDDEDED